MAYSKTPSISTYDTKRIGLVGNPQQRSGATPQKDLRLVNVMVEMLGSQSTEGKQFTVKSRPGLTASYTVNTGEARGLYNWLYSGTNYIFSVVDDKVYVNGTLVLTLTTTTGAVGFCEHVSSVAAFTLVLVDGVKGYVFTDSTTYTEITAVDFPTPHVPFPVFLDGYVLLAKADTQDVYNSNLDDPLLWTAGEYFSAEMYPDKVVALTKNNNYIYAVGTNSIEYLYDAAEATGSPLGRHPSAVQQFGCAAIGTVVQTDKEVFMVGQSAAGGHTVWSIEGFKEKEISIPAVRNALLAEGANLVNAKAYSIRVASQKLYVIVLTSRTLVYSVDTQMWHEWASGATNGSNFVGEFACDGPNGTPYILHKNGTTISKMSEDYFTDNGTAFMCEITTEKMDFDTINRKFMSRLTLLGIVPDSTDVDNDVYISWSDDDYKSWSTPRVISFNYDFPVMGQLGSFRRRAFKIQYSLPHLFILEGIEVDINKGIQ